MKSHPRFRPGIPPQAGLDKKGRAGRTDEQTDTETTLYQNNKMASSNIFRRGGSAMSGILNVLGMAVAFAAFYIILVQVNYDLNFNKGIKDSEKVFVMTSGSMDNDGKRQMNFCRPLAEIILQSSPNIEYGGSIDLGAQDTRLWMEKDGARQDIILPITLFSGDALKVLDFEAVSGSFDEMTEFSNLAISETIAGKFGLEVGMTLYFQDGNATRTIKAIFKDMPQNSHFRDVHVVKNICNTGITNFSEWGYHYFIKVHDPAQIKDMQETVVAVTHDHLMKEYFGAMPSAEEMGMTQEEMDDAVKTVLKNAEVEFMALEDLYYSDRIANMIERGNRTTTVILLIVAILIVGIAFINYINFFFAQIPERIRAVNTKKVLGCTRSELIISTVRESVTLIFFALILAFVFVMLFNMSQLTHLISADSAFSVNIGLTVLTVAVAFVISIISSLYPAFYITSFEPAMVLKGSFSGTKAGQRLRYILIGLQFVISLVLIICASFIYLQRSYMVNFDMGFEKEHLLYVHTGAGIGKNAEIVEQQLKTDPQILDVTWASGNLLASQRMGWGRNWNGTTVNFQCYAVAPDFPEFMGIEITEGRTFSKEDDNSLNGRFIFNETARRQYGFTLEDRIVGHTDEGAEIVGFCEDFSFKTLKEEVTPFALYVYGQNPWYYPYTAFIRVSAGADYTEVKKHIATVLSGWAQNISLEEWEIYFFDDNLNATYRKEQALSQLISIFTLIAIIISLMGVFGLVMFETQYRRKEIALRRVNGATVGNILNMFCSRFVKIVLVCFAVAAPVSWIIAGRYLATFAHRCPIYWWVFALALLAVLLVTVGVVLLRSWNAATADPAEALKSE